MKSNFEIREQQIQEIIDRAESEIEALDVRLDEVRSAREKLRAEEAEIERERYIAIKALNQAQVQSDRLYGRKDPIDC